MSKKFTLYFFLLSSLSFSACHKEDLPEYDYKTLGTSAHDLMAAVNYASLTIEIDYMPGYAPDATALNNLEFFLNTYINKPDGILVVQKQISGSNKTSLTLDDLVLTEKKYRNRFTGMNTIAVHILIADADYSDPSIFGLSYWNTSFCLFGKNIFASSGGAGQVSRTILLTTLLEHEFGHLLGLVGQGSPAQVSHRDLANGAHCNNSACLMHYAIETGMSVMGVPSLDTNCINDLKANGGK